ncbi:MAG TPA: lysophospholipid acyltransferase family protein [bacterium]|nr:lysophospholipid acyltransferase family protein [bacterium]
MPFAAPLFLIPDRRGRRKRAGKALTRIFFRFFTWLMRALGVLDLEILGLEHLQEKDLLILANHPTLIDFVVLAGIVPRADCLVKSSLLSHWAMRWPVSLAGYIPNDRGEKTLGLCKSSLESGNSIVIFPEGTRSTPGKALRLKSGAVQLALRCAPTMTQVVIDCRESNLERGGRWYLAPVRKMLMRVHAFPAYETAPVIERHGGQTRLAARELIDLLERRFDEVLERG